jgi:hypothetical protein
MPNQEIRVATRESYGQPKIYPICQKAQTFAVIAGTRTLTPATIKLIESLGFEIKLNQTKLSDLI